VVLEVELRWIVSNGESCQIGAIPECFGGFLTEDGELKDHSLFNIFFSNFKLGIQKGL